MSTDIDGCIYALKWLKKKKSAFAILLTGPGCNLKPVKAAPVRGNISLPVIGGLSIRDLKELKK